MTYELDDDAVTQIDEGEDEHCADFQRVLDVSYKALEDAATEISMQWFTGKEAALGALVSLLSASGPNPLVPAEPLKLSNWTRRLKEVANLLESQSRRKRDVEHRDHSSSGYRMTEEARDGSNVHVVLIPTFANPHRTPEEVVSLADI